MTRRATAAASSALLAALLAGTVQSAPPAIATATAHGLLWKIQGQGQEPSYLFGTIHLADPRVTRLPPPVQAAFDTTRRLIVEVVPDTAGLARLAESMRFTDDRSLKQTVGGKMYADARAAFAKRGIPLNDFDKYKPWAVTLILLLPDQSGGMPIDLALQVLAAEKGVPVDGLETMEEQIDVFDDLSLDEQRALLKSTLRDQAKVAGRMEALVRAYLARDLTELQALADDDATDPALHAKVMRRLLTDRNRRMVARMQSSLRRGDAFIAVGAAHLPGPRGIIELLRREGYDVSAVY